MDSEDTGLHLEWVLAELDAQDIGVYADKHCVALDTPKGNYIVPVRWIQFLRHKPHRAQLIALLDSRPETPFQRLVRESMQKSLPL
jgi:hypothetical protein